MKKVMFFFVIMALSFTASNRVFAEKDTPVHFEELENELIQEGISKKDAAELIDSMNKLVKDGENPKKLGNIVSHAAHAAKEEGFKGKDLAVKVHGEIQEKNGSGRN